MMNKAVKNTKKDKKKNNTHLNPKLTKAVVGQLELIGLFNGLNLKKIAHWKVACNLYKASLN